MGVLDRELEYHERLYSGFAQKHFARPAVRALRAHMVQRILSRTGAGSSSSVLSLGCGIGDTELLLAPHVRQLTGIDLSPRAIEQARADAGAARIANASFEQGSLDTVKGTYDVIFAIFFLHHLPGDVLDAAPRRIRALLNPGGRFYSLDPSRMRLSGAIGRVIVPGLMRRYQTPDERELDAAQTADRFRAAGFEAQHDYYDFVSSPMAGLFPGWRSAYRLTRALDDAVVRVPALRRLGSNFEIYARTPGSLQPFTQQG
ncbi:MAG: class I SAM-dependent methyltransferase [Bryobacteraceae bacterium]